MDKEYYLWENLKQDIPKLVKYINRRINLDPISSVYGVPRGGIPIAVALSYTTGIPLATEVEPTTLVVDDIIDSGDTRLRYASNEFFALYRKSYEDRERLFFGDHTRWLHSTDKWVVFPWEVEEEETVEDNVRRILQYIGEDPQREGLLETPSRVVRSYEELFAGYKVDVAQVVKTFSNADNGNYEEIVLCKDIEIYSMCEHHMLPFAGRAHVAYVPDSLVIGLSKMARLVDTYARRLQTQERLCGQVTDALVRYLKPHGAACIIEAEHFCMRMRGVGKQNSKMTTSSLQGLFLEDSDRGRAARAELMTLIKE